MNRHIQVEKDEKADAGVGGGCPGSIALYSL